MPVGPNINRIVEIHDSTLACVEFSNSDVVICLSPAIVHHSEGKPGIDVGNVWLQEIDLVISDGIRISSPSTFPNDLWGGSFEADGVCEENGFPLPLEVSVSVLFTAETMSGEKLVIRGSGTKSIERGEPRYLELFRRR